MRPAAGAPPSTRAPATAACPLAPPHPPHPPPRCRPALTTPPPRQLPAPAAYVLAYEVLFGQGLREQGPAERAVLRARGALKAALSELLRRAGAKVGGVAGGGLGESSSGAVHRA